MNTLTIQIPDVDIVDFKDQTDVESYVGLMIQAGNELGAFMRLIFARLLNGGRCAKQPGR